MFEKRNISEEEALKRACKQNGFEFVPNNTELRKTITIVDDEGKETVLDNKYNVVKLDDTVRMQGVMGFTKAGVVTVTNAVNPPPLVAIQPKTGAQYRLEAKKRRKYAINLSDEKVDIKGVGTTRGRSRISKHGVRNAHKGVTQKADK